MSTSFRSGFISIVGKPNVGKSTLLNRLVGEKLAGVSRKPQTTRQTIRGILTQKKGQAVFLDTPGFHQPHDRLGEWMLGEIRRALEGSDLIYWMVFPRPPDAEDRRLLEQLRQLRGQPPLLNSSEGSGQAPLGGQTPLGGQITPGQANIFLVINQVDQVKKPALFPVIDAWQNLFPFREIIPVSALRRDNLDRLVKKTFDVLPVNPAYFEADQLSDQNERVLVAEMIREKVFRFTGEEIPYSSAVEIEEFQEKSERLAVIKAAVIVEKDSQKAILIGKGGAKVKQIGENARREIERFLGKKVYLELWVKTLRNWKKDPVVLKRLGYR